MGKTQNCPSKLPITSAPNEAIRNLFKLLAEGEAELCGVRKVENATLVIGNAGSGKSTFIQRIAGYGDTMISATDDGTNFYIGYSFIIDDTSFPDLLEDRDSGAAYYDLPGFKDDREPAQDIATTYFIKRRVDDLEQVKILILIDYISLTPQGTRDDFSSFLQHVTNFLPNVDKYRDGIALIATKVEYPNIEDEKIIMKIAEFINEEKRQLEKKQDNSGVHSDALKLLSILLQRDGDKYPRVWISRSPNKGGLLSKIPIIKENTRKIKIMLEKLKYVEKNESDFGYVVQKRSLVDIETTLSIINHSIDAEVQEIGKEVQKYLSSDGNQSYDITKQFNITSFRHDQLMKIKLNANNQQSLEKCAQEVVKGSGLMNIHSIHQNAVLTFANYSSFIQKVGNVTQVNQFKCADGLQNAIDNSMKLKKWWNFLNRLYDRLSDYEVLRDPTNSTCTTFAENVANVIQAKNNTKFPFDLSALKKCYPNYESEFQEIRPIMDDESKLKTVEKVLNSTLKSNQTYVCESNKLVIKGHYVKLGDIPQIQKTSCAESPKFIEIFALSEIFINADLNKTGELLQLSIVAPIWNILGLCKITLDGKSADPHSPRKASNGCNSGNMSSDGVPGLPGGPGGNFLGIGETFKNLQGLTISVKGGNGGPGQDGGNDGNGGSGGIGGYSGKIIFVPVSSSDIQEHLHTVIGMGSNGPEGKDGEGSVGGTNSSDLEVKTPQLRYPEQGRKISNVPYVVDKYKNYTMENLQQSVRESYMREFLQKLENDNRLKSQPQRCRRFVDDAGQMQTINHENVPGTKNNFKTSHAPTALEPGTSNADDTSVKSAGVRINSPINFAVNLVNRFIGHWMFFSTTTIPNYGLVKGDIEFMYRGSKPSDIHTTAEGSTNHAMQQGNFNVNESLTLADFAIRCITKKKFYNSEEKSMDLSEVKAYVLNIITDLEKILSDVSAQYNLPPESLEFDPVSLIPKLEKELIRQNYKKVAEVLYESIENNVLINNPEFHAHLLHKLDKISERQKEGHFKEHYFKNYAM